MTIPPQFSIKNIAGRISRVLYSLRSLYHLSRPEVSPTAHQQPTPRHRTSNPYLSVYMVLQPVRRTAGTCRHARGGLLPHLFTLTGSRSLRRLFSVTRLSPHEDLPVRKDGALCCPDFPPPATVSRHRQR